MELTPVHRNFKFNPLQSIEIWDLTHSSPSKFGIDPVQSIDFFLGPLSGSSKILIVKQRVHRNLKHFEIMFFFWDALIYLKYVGIYSYVIICMSVCKDFWLDDQISQIDSDIRISWTNQPPLAKTARSGTAGAKAFKTAWCIKYRGSAGGLAPGTSQCHGRGIKSESLQKELAASASRYSTARW